MDYLTLATKCLGVGFDEIFIMQRGDCGEMRSKIDKMGLWEYRNSLTECQLANNDLVKLLHGEYKIKQIDKKEDSKKILPIPCMKLEETTIGGWFQRINEGLDKLKEAVLEAEGGLNLCLTKRWWQGGDYGIPQKAADTITAITSMLEVMGIDENMRQEAQKRVNEKNKELGRF